ncbi:MAG TPA: hypothetical protein VLZ78_07870, partial [Terrimesophilobacter sp.]|nr:hypothetical protein [Terrimesophilobacter sp.]
MGIPFDVLQTANADLNRVQANAAHAFSLVPEAVGIDVTATSKDLRIAGEGGVVVLDTTPRAVTLFLPAPRSDRVVVLLNKSRYAAHVRTADAKQTFPDVDAGAIGVAICDGAKWYVSGSLGGESTTPGSSGGSTTPFPPVPPLDAPYWLSTATPGLPNGVSLGVLGTGVLEQTSDGTTASPVVRPLTNMAVLFGGSDSLIAQDTNYFIYSPATVGLGIGSVPAAEAILTARRNANTQAALFVSNTDGGTDATSAVVAQAATSDTYLTIPYVVNGVFGRGTVSAPWNPYYVPGATLHGGATRVGHVFEIGTDMATSPPWWWVNRVGLATQQLRMQLDWDGHLFLPSSLGAGGIVWADSATTPAGQLKLVTIGTGLSFSGGTLSATGGTGTVTGVTGTAPMVVTPATPNPNVSLTIDGSLGVSAGALQRAALTGDATAGAGSNALTLATVNSSPGTFAYATVTVNGKGLATAVAAGATPALAARTLSATAPLLIGGGHGPLDLSADRTFSHDTSGVGAGTYNWASIIVDAYGHVTAAAANAAPQPAITWPAAKDILVSTGTSSNPTGEAAFTYDTAVNLFRLDG